jgi:hypothetical protein
LAARCQKMPIVLPTSLSQASFRQNYGNVNIIGVTGVPGCREGKEERDVNVWRMVGWKTGAR